MLRNEAQGAEKTRPCIMSCRCVLSSLLLSVAPQISLTLNKQNMSRPVALFVIIALVNVYDFPTLLYSPFLRFTCLILPISCLHLVYLSPFLDHFSQ